MKNWDDTNIPELEGEIIITTGAKTSKTFNDKSLGKT